MSVELDKWPRLLVIGQNVTPAQAGEILVRTDSRTLFTNDQVWEAEARRILGLPPEGAPEGWREAFHARRAAWERLRAVEDLEYMTNNRIASAHVLGPHGWCDWEGVIGCSTYTVGKHPTVEAISAEWEAIAAAFPYLELTAQVVNDDCDTAAATWSVTDGAVTVQDGPAPLICALTQPEDEAVLFRFAMRAEWGVSPERLAAAVASILDGS